MTDVIMFIPTCASEFLSAISSDLKKWQMAIIDAEACDENNDSRSVFWLASDDGMTTYVAHEYGRMIVNVEKNYHFNLGEINKDQEWTWSKHLASKGWATSHQLELVKTLEKLFKDYI